MKREHRLTRREVLALGAMGLGAGLAFPFAGAPLVRRAWGREVTVKAGYLSIATSIQYFAAKERGFFKAEGITLDDAAARAAVVTLEGIASGSYELGFATTIDITQINLKGINVKILYPGPLLSTQHQFARLMVPMGSTIKTAKDFEGLKVGVSVTNTSQDLIVKRWLAAKGANPTKVSFVELGFAGILPALKAKTVAAVYAIEPQITLINAQKIGESFAFPHEVLGAPLLVVGYVARDSWIEKNPETAQAIVRALDKTTQWLMEHPQEIPGVVARNTRITAELAQKMVLPGLTRVARKAELQPFVDIAAEYGYIPRSLDTCSLFSRFCPQEC